MKKYLSISLLLTTVLVMSCQQEIAELTPPVQETGGEPGSANFTKFISVGNSLTAGFQAGALFTEGQNNSFPSIMAKQFSLVSENDEFNQPDINSVNGYNASSSNPGIGLILGRLILFDPDGTFDPADPEGCVISSRTPSPTPSGAPARTVTCPSTVTTPAVPAPYNTANLPTNYEGDRTKLNNFGVPGILLGQALTPDTGNPASPFYNGLWARFASAPGVKSILDDAIATNPTFFSFWLGNNDVLGYATTGGLFPTTGGVPLTSEASFTTNYNLAINSLLAANANVKGVVATIPDVTTIPFFKTVLWNQIEFKTTDCTAQAQITQLNAMSAFGGYNAALDALVAGAVPGVTLTAENAAKRKVVYNFGKNGVLLRDETLPDLTAALSAINPALAAYGQARQATSEDLILLSAGGVLGTCVTGNPAQINGVSVPLADQFVLIPSEITAIKERTVALNNIIKNVVTANSSRLALADVNTKFTEVVTGVTRTVDGIPINATFAPPTGLFSEDGVHPNNRGSAYIARVFIEAINSKFGSTVPLPNIATYKSTPLPVSPPL